MTNLTPEQRALGRSNFNEAIGSTRRDFLKAAAAAPMLGAFYFGYGQLGGAPVKAAIIGTGNEGCGAMIHDHNRDYVDYIGYCDIRPYNQKRAVKEFTNHKQYTPADVQKLRKYADVKEMLADKDVEMVVIALPLWLHAPVAIEAMKAGKHVFCEKLMAHNISECKEMIKVAHDTNRLLAIGHQRHYSVLYDNANYLLQQNQLGEIRHIRALWHRNNARPQIEKDKSGNYVYESDGSPRYVRDKAGNIQYQDSWKPPIPAEDAGIDYAKHGYKSLEELVRWRLFNRTGAGLMAELGSHQLDACSIFLGKKHPLAVTGVGGTFFYTDHREVDDHVFVSFEFPGKTYDPKVKRDNGDHVVVTYSSINTNAFENYGETVYGTRGTMIVEGEKEILLYPEAGLAATSRSTAISVETKASGKPVIEVSPSTAAAPTAAASLGGLAVADPSRGYREELEHFAYCIRNSDKNNYHAQTDPKLIPRCRGEVALADAVIALTSNIAMREKRRIEFEESWFDWKSPEVPESKSGSAVAKS
ncbi:MAG: Gfo/Idh/MocA family oxidoreductase [Isosphaeraceae bacterium]|nr:Gfo/Idh/MocA family oxidoreductase [Isosphaeraceae bacterium]